MLALAPICTDPNLSRSQIRLLHTYPDLPTNYTIITRMDVPSAVGNRANASA